MHGVDSGALAGAERMAHLITTFQHPRARHTRAANQLPAMHARPALPRCGAPTVLSVVCGLLCRLAGCNAGLPPCPAHSRPLPGAGSGRYLQFLIPALFFMGSFEAMKRYLYAQVRGGMGEGGS